MSEPKVSIIAAIMLVLALVLGGCLAPAARPSSSPTGKIVVYVTDAPPGDEVTGIMVTVSEIQIHRAGAEQETEQEPTQPGKGEWITIDLNEESATFDLLKVIGVEQFIGSAEEIDEGKYTQVRLVVEKAQVRLDGGDYQDATVPSGELKITHPFDVMGDETTALVIDFDADKMVTVTGSDKIIVKPVVKVTSRQEGKSKQEELAVEVSCDEFSAENHITKEGEVSVGDLIELTLCSNPSTGFEWEQAKISDTSVVEEVERKFKGSEDEDMVGAPGRDVWTFKALAEGTATVSIEYSRPWEGGEKGEWTFGLTVTVK